MEPDAPHPPGLHCRPPARHDGARLHALARDAGGLDVNSQYAYHLWCREFADSSVVAWHDDEAVGFVTGFRRPTAPDRLFVWQVAVRAECRGAGVGTAMLDALVSRPDPPRHLDATVTPSNEASRAMFERFAARHDAAVVERPFLGADELPDGHEPEVLLEIGPLAPSSSVTSPSTHPSPSTVPSAIRESR